MFIITADIRGVKYYIRIMQRAFHGKVISWSHVGLKNNATRYKTEGEAEKDLRQVDSDWELKVESY